MKVGIKKKIGRSVLSFDFEEGKIKDALFIAAGITTMPEICGNCQSANIQLQSNKAEKEGKTYKYIKIRCADCKATSTMGENLDGVNVFWKRFEVYNPNFNEGEDHSAQKAPAQSTKRVEVDDDDIPF